MLFMPEIGHCKLKFLNDGLLRLVERNSTNRTMRVDRSGLSPRENAPFPPVGPCLRHQAVPYSLHEPRL